MGRIFSRVLTKMLMLELDNALFDISKSLRHLDIIFKQLKIQEECANHGSTIETYKN